MSLLPAPQHQRKNLRSNFVLITNRELKLQRIYWFTGFLLHIIGCTASISQHGSDCDSYIQLGWIHTKLMKGQVAVWSVAANKTSAFIVKLFWYVLCISSFQVTGTCFLGTTSFLRTLCAPWERYISFKLNGFLSFHMFVIFAKCCVLASLGTLFVHLMLK